MIGTIRHYRKKGTAHSRVEEYLRKVMVEYTCPDCDGAKLKRERLLVTVDSKDIHRLGEMHLEELSGFLKQVEIPEKTREAGTRISQCKGRRLQDASLYERSRIVVEGCQVGEAA